MEIYQVTLKSGAKRWEGFEEGPKHPITGKRQQIRRRGSTKREVKNKIEKAIQKLKDGEIDDRMAKKVTFDNLAKDWLDLYSLGGVKQSTIDIRKKDIKALNKHFEDIPVVNITHRQYQNFIKDISNRLARSSVLRINSTAGQIFVHGIKEGVLKINPQDGVIIPKKSRTVEQIESDPIQQKYLEHEELEEFFNAVRLYGLEFDLEIFYLLALTGIRSGELCALKWSDIDFNSNTISITKTLYTQNNNVKNYLLMPPKSEKSIRKIDIGDKLMNLLKLHRKREMLKKQRYRNLNPEFHDENFIFTKPHGYPFIQKNISERMHRLLEYTKIKKRATPHIFRHTYISLQTEAGVDLPIIMERVGHSDTQTTIGIYTHVTNKMKKEASEKMDHIYDELLKNITF